MKVAAVAVLLVTIIISDSNCAMSKRDALRWLKTGGYYSKSDSEISRLSESDLDDEIQIPLQEMRDYYKLPRSGGLDRSVEHIMSKPRCGRPDRDGGSSIRTSSSSRKPSSSSTRSSPSSTRSSSSPSRSRFDDIFDLPSSSMSFGRFKRFTRLGNTVWRDMPVTLGFKNYHSSMSQSLQEDVALGCARKWAEVSGLSFRLVRNQVANVYIEFKFLDGNFGQIGRGVSPTPFNNPPSSMVTMDSGEKWRARRSSPATGGPSFEEGLCHEMGHSLGLGHSSDPDSIMRPSLPGWSFDVRLSADDINGIRSLYGPSNGRTIEGSGGPVQPPETSQPPAPSPNRPPVQQTPRPTGNNCSGLSGYRLYLCQRGVFRSSRFNFFTFGK